RTGTTATRGVGSSKKRKLMKLTAGFGRISLLSTRTRSVRQVGGIAFPDQDPVEVACVKFGDDDYLNHPPEEEKAFLERRQKDGTPIDWPDYKEWSQAYDAFKARERAMYFERADSWQLVLQIDSDEEMQWWDDGRIYVCIRRRDLSER